MCREEGERRDTELVACPCTVHTGVRVSKHISGHMTSMRVHRVCNSRTLVCIHFPHIRCKPSTGGLIISTHRETRCGGMHMRQQGAYLCSKRDLRVWQQRPTHMFDWSDKPRHTQASKETTSRRDLLQKRPPPEAPGTLNTCSRDHAVFKRPRCVQETTLCSRDHLKWHQGP